MIKRFAITSNFGKRKGYSSIMATCQELVELAQTSFKIMLTAFGSLALPKQIT